MIQRDALSPSGAGVEEHSMRIVEHPLAILAVGAALILACLR